MSKRLTKQQIIDETAEYYGKDPVKRRAMNKDDDGNPHCMYVTEDKRKCAVGRCLNQKALTLIQAKPHYLTVIAFEFINDYEDAKNGEEPFMPRYQGHEKRFWSDLQSLHDTEVYWDSSGLTESGKRYVRELKHRYWGK